MEKRDIAHVLLLGLVLVVYIPITYGGLYPPREDAESRQVTSFLTTLDQFLSQIVFPSRQQCMAIMCAPRRSERYPFHHMGYGPLTLGITGPLTRPGTDYGSNPFPGSSSDELDIIRRYFGGDVIFIRNYEGRVVGVCPGSGTGSAGLGGGILGTAQGIINSFDVDICCRTEVAFYMNSTLTDVYGYNRTIAQIAHTGSYQFIRHGFCGDHGACEGQCEVQYVTQSLAVHPPKNDELISYSFFEIPGYCTCRVPLTFGSQSTRQSK